MVRTRFTLAVACLALLVLVLSTGVASAASGPLVGNYWDEFLDHWLRSMKKQNGAIMIALGVGVVTLFIITRGKWRK